jgi:hypothetical protein
VRLGRILLKIFLGMESMHAKPALLFNHEALMRLVVFNHGYEKAV